METPEAFIDLNDPGAWPERCCCGSELNLWTVGKTPFRTCPVYQEEGRGWSS